MSNRRDRTRVIAALAIALALLLAVTGWLVAKRNLDASAARHFDSPHLAPTARKDDSGLPSPAATMEDSTSSTRLPANVSSPGAEREIRIVSRAGFELHNVWIVSESGYEQRALARSILCVSPRRDTFVVKVPGHAERKVGPDEQHVELLPDFLLVLHAQDLMRRVREADFVQARRDPAGLAQIAMWGKLGDDAWALAIDAADFVDGYGARADVRLGLTGYEMFRALQNVAPGLSITREVPLARAALDPALRPFIVDIEAPSDGEISVELWCEHAQASTARDYLLASSNFDNGAIQLYRPRMELERRLTHPARRADFGSLPVGLTLGVSAIQRSTGAFVRASFVHDGEPHVLALHPGTKFSGRLIPPTGRALPSNVSLRWHFRGEGSKSDAPGFWDGRADLPLSEFGRFEFALPQTVAKPAEVPPTPPRRFELVIEAAPYRPLELVLVRDLPEQDMGDFQLSENVVTLLLSGDGVLPRADLSHERLHVPLSGASGSYVVRAAAPRGLDLELQLNLRETGDDGVDRYSFLNHATQRFEGAPWLKEPPVAFVIGASGAYERGADDLYRSTPVRMYEVSLRPSTSAGERVLVGWCWRDVFVPLPWQRESKNAVVTLRFEAPARGVSCTTRTAKGERIDEYALPLPPDVVLELR